MGHLYYTAMQSFRVLQGREEKHVLHTKKELEQFAATVATAQAFSETQIYLTERDIRKNFKKVFDY